MKNSTVYKNERYRHLYFQYAFKSDVTEDEIVGAMKRDYEDAAEEKIRETVSEFVSKLKEADVLE